MNDFDKYNLYASEGNVSCQFRMGIIYEEGLYNQEKNMEKAVYWYLIASNNGHCGAMNNLAVCYKKGEGIEKDTEKAFTLFEKASAIGNSVAMYNLAMYYHSGYDEDIYIEKDYEKAFSLFELSAKMGDENSQYYLGLYYENGIIVDKNIEKAIYWYERSAHKNYLPSQLKLIKLYKNNLNNLEKSHYWYNIYLKNNNHNNQNNYQDIDVLFKSINI